MGNCLVLQDSSGSWTSPGVVAGTPATAGRRQQPLLPEQRRPQHEDALVHRVPVIADHDYRAASLRNAFLRNRRGASAMQTTANCAVLLVYRLGRGSDHSVGFLDLAEVR